MDLLTHSSGLAPTPPLCFPPSLAAVESMDLRTSSLHRSFDC
jgi:hypothetical protein